MQNLVLVIHILTALAIIVLILLQQGKGAAAGASFGAGASQTVFGSEGSGNFFTRATTFFAVVFFCTSFGLAIIAKNQASVGDVNIPTVLESAPASAPAASDVPAVQEDQDSASDIPAAPADE